MRLEQGWAHCSAALEVWRSGSEVMALGRGATSREQDCRGLGKEGEEEEAVNGACCQGRRWGHKVK